MAKGKRERGNDKDSRGAGGLGSRGDRETVKSEK
jgi:hypothetical protein